MGFRNKGVKMPQNVKIQIIPTRATETISISCTDYINKFKGYFRRPDLIQFFIFGKTTVGNNIYFEIRSMRVNEFVTMLDDFGIRWRHITEKYK
jgi:hypothetical protein